MISLNHSVLYNAMIYPLTRMVIYGVIWYQGKFIRGISIYYRDLLDFICVGEANTVYNHDKYTCTFSKMIQYWRQIWNQRTNGITDIHFPFGFVQVDFLKIIKRIFMDKPTEQKKIF
jgi:hypothetical protein